MMNLNGVVKKKKRQKNNSNISKRVNEQFIIYEKVHNVNKKDKKIILRAEK